MLTGKFPHLALTFVAASVLLAGVGVVRAQDSQDQSQSVADAARRAREDKKNSTKSATKPAKVITDDDMPKSPSSSGGVNVGAPPKLDTEPPPEGAVVAQEKADAAAESGNPKKGDSPLVVKLKEDLATAEKELDLAQRELALDQETFYSNNDYVHDKAGQTKLADEQQDIINKKQHVDDLKAQLAAAQEEEARKKAAASDKAATANTQPAQPQQ